MFDRVGVQYGYVSKRTPLDKHVGGLPKNLSMLDRPNEGAWYAPMANKRKLIVVEDQLSALRASEYMTSVALLGTHVTDTIKDSIKAGKFDVVYLALDPDAFTKSIKLARELREDIPVQVLRLPKDIKDMTHEEVGSLFEAILNDDEV